MKKIIFVLLAFLLFQGNPPDNDTYIRINLLGYKPGSHKSAVWCSKTNKSISDFKIVEVQTGKTVYK
ncbi:MAG TPA: cellulase N-terminal Ig-like domain-containing protein, partial [Cyclobacteriaceae bacterium]|nr:cellulase N-terminal Ig-like domain-containing protein [Cyclobacteriaceae bacterium]